MSLLSWMQPRGVRARAATGLAACLAATMFVAAGCGSGGDSSSGGGEAEADRPKIKVAAIGELSGAYQQYGSPMEQVLSEITKEVNAEGIEVAGETYDVEYETFDDRSDPTVVPTVAREALGMEPNIVLGPFLNGQSSYSILKEANAVYLGSDIEGQTVLQEEEVTEPLFTVTSFYNESVPSFVRRIHEYAPDIKTVAVLTQDDAAGRGTVAPLIEGGLEELGMEVVSSSFYPPTTKDFAPFLTPIKAEKPDALFAFLNEKPDLEIARQAAALDVATYIFPDNVLPKDIVSSPEAANSTLLLPTWNPVYGPYATLPSYEPEKIFAQGPTASPQSAVAYYYSVQMTLQAMQEAGTTTDAQAITDALAGMTWDGPMGPCTMSTRHALDCSAPMFVVESGEVTLYDYESLSATEPRGVYACQEDKCTPKES